MSWRCTCGVTFPDNHKHITISIPNHTRGTACVVRKAAP